MADDPTTTAATVTASMLRIGQIATEAERKRTEAWLRFARAVVSRETLTVPLDRHTR